MPTRFRRILLLLPVSLSVCAGEMVLSSGDGQRVLMELYTSEGCSSCPPMERYINGFTTQDALWEVFIPVAFHVDYWDYIGWEDRFASPEFAARQRQHAREGSVRSVYTPTLIVNGKGWRPGLSAELPKPNTRSTGTLNVRVDQKSVTADFESVSGDVQSLDLHIALLGMGLESSITAGENQGRTLRHDFVVIGFKSLQGANAHWHTRLPELRSRDTEPRALAVWVTDSGRLKPLQAVGGYLDGYNLPP